MLSYTGARMRRPKISELVDPKQSKGTIMLPLALAFTTNQTANTPQRTRKAKTPHSDTHAPSRRKHNEQQTDDKNHSARTQTGRRPRHNTQTRRPNTTPTRQTTHTPPTQLWRCESHRATLNVTPLRSPYLTHKTSQISWFQLNWLVPICWFQYVGSNNNINNRINDITNDNK